MTRDTGIRSVATPSSCCPRKCVCTCANGPHPMDHARDYTFEREAPASIYFPLLSTFPFPHCSRQQCNPFLIRRTFIQCYFSRGSRPPETPRAVEDTICGQNAHQTGRPFESSVQELLGNWLSSQGRREEARIGYSVVSLVNMLCGHILFPFPSLLHLATALAHRIHSQQSVPLHWPILQATCQPNLMLEPWHLGEWILREIIRQRIQNKCGGQTPESHFFPLECTAV